MNQSTDFIPFARPSMGVEEEEAVLRVMRSGWLTTGTETLAFEKEFAQYVGVPLALAVNSATSGLHLALEALGIGAGDVVVTSPYTFTSTAAVARHLGAEVVFCDVAPGSYNLDPEALARLLASTRNCRAIIAVHVGGLPCDMAAIRALGTKYGCAVVEDAAHSFPSPTPEGYAGTLGDVGVYSFYATKTITTGEGGMVVARDPKVCARIASMRSHGFDRAAWDRYTSTKPSWHYAVTEAGFKYNLPDILSAIGREQLKKASLFLEQRIAIAAVYDAAFSSIPCLELPPHGVGHSWHLYALRVKPGKCDVTRDALVGKLAEKGIGTSVHFIPLHTMPYYAQRYSLTPESFPNAYSMFERSISLPIWQGMDLSMAERVAAEVIAMTGTIRA
jgi:dTDP-4-amino-4,6-dideoxygalactose transaminase